MRAAQVAGRLQSLHLLDLLRPGIMVRGDVSVAEALRRANASGARGIVVVDSADRPQAIVDEARVLLVTPQRQPWTPVAAVARALEPGLLLPAALHTDELLSAIRRTPASEYLVVHPDGSPAGILATGDLAGVLSAPRARPQPTGTSPASGGPLVPGPPLAGGRR
jgi:CBS domain-containing protein